MPSLTLQASPRTVMGKQVKRLRRTGLVPGTVSGPHITQQAIQIPVKEVERVARRAGSSALVELRVDGESQGRNVVLRHVAYDVLSRIPIHVTLFQVQMDEPMVAEVPLQLTGEAPAVKAEGGILLSLMTHLHVRALPGQMPSAIAVDVSGLTHVNDAIHVRDLRLPEGVETTVDLDELVTKVNASHVASKLADEVTAVSEAAEVAPPAENEPAKSEPEG